MEAIDQQDVASFDPRGLIGTLRIYVGTTRHYYILINLSGLMVSEIFNVLPL